MFEEVLWCLWQYLHSWGSTNVFDIQLNKKARVVIFESRLIAKKKTLRLDCTMKACWVVSKLPIIYLRRMPPTKSSPVRSRRWSLISNLQKSLLRGKRRTYTPRHMLQNSPPRKRTQVVVCWRISWAELQKYVCLFGTVVPRTNDEIGQLCQYVDQDCQHESRNKWIVEKKPLWSAVKSSKS